MGVVSLVRTKKGVYDEFFGSFASVVTCMQLKTRKCTSKEVEHSFGMYKVCVSHSFLVLCDKKERRKAEKSKFSCSPFRLFNGLAEHLWNSYNRISKAFVCKHLYHFPLVMKELLPYTLRTGCHFEPAPSLHKKYYCTF